ncbi:MAG: zinc-binding dehydrogenase [Myxococcota bacterium]|nr:zinc-binding dehydrogenase [Myxococcota bacterium]
MTRPQMRALVVKSHQGGAASLDLTTSPVVALGPGQVRIQVAAAPINPNDLLALRDAYDVQKPIGAVAGFEGSGVVVEGRGAMARMLVGRRVAFAASPRSGSWAELAVADANRCAPLRAGVSHEQGATMLTNPLTATVLVEQARRERHRAVVQTAAAGALGKMVARLALELGLPMIHVVRAEGQAAALRTLGAQHVLDSSTPEFEARLAALCAKLGATLALDSVGGPLTGTLLRALQPGGVVRVFGWLSGAPLSVDPTGLIFHGKRIEGFTMYEWIQRTSMLRQIATVMRAQGRLGGPLSTEVRSRSPLEQFAAALASYEEAMSGGKILFQPSPGDAARVTLAAP